MDNSLLSKSVKINIQPVKIKEDQKVDNEKLDPDVQDSVSDPLLEVKVDDSCCNGKVESNCQIKKNVSAYVDQKLAIEKLDPYVQDSLSNPLLEDKFIDTCCNGKVESKCEIKKNLSAYVDQKLAIEKLDPDVQDSLSNPLLEVKFIDTCCNGKAESKCEVKQNGSVDNKINGKLFKQNNSLLPDTKIIGKKNKNATITDTDNGSENPQPVTYKDMCIAMKKFIWLKGNIFYKARVLFALFLLVAAKVLNTSVPFIFKEVVDDLNAITGSWTGSELNLSDPNHTIVTMIFALITGYGLARAGSAFCNQLRSWIFATVAQHSIRKIAQDVFLHLHNLDLQFHLNRQTGSLSKAVDRGSRGIATVLNAMVFNIAPTIFELTLVSIVLAYKCGAEFTGVAIGAVFIYALWTLKYTQWRTQFRIAMNKADQEAGNKAVDSLINYETVKYFNNEAYEAETYDKSLMQYEKAAIRTSETLAKLNFGQQVIFNIALSCVMLLAANKITEGKMTVGDLVMVNGLLFQLSIPLAFLGSTYREMTLALTDMEVMFQLLRVEPQIKSSADAKLTMLSSAETDITFENVTFEYLEGKQILNGLSFKVAAGKRVAIVGGSGAGKSTIVRLLYRFFEPKSGSIKIGDKEIKAVDLEFIRKHISIVPQDTVLFHNTIKHNINYGNLEASEDQVIKAAQMAELHKSILTWPNGYETQVGERGLKLSGGEKQRVSIARAILKNSPILVFDEATSSLDSITEKSIMKALDKATEGRTSIIIAHRLSTVVNCDEIFVVDKGRVVENGTHRELLAQEESLYSKLWNSQQSKCCGCKIPIEDERDDRHDIPRRSVDSISIVACASGCC